ncbi:MAG: deoxyguanosinetriphosphate triphosphohydrolase [bacterium]
MTSAPVLVTPRQRWEAFEHQCLAPWAAFADASAGRPRPEEPDPLRTCFQRDRDRILHAKAFRRLKHKTQVYIAPEGDHYRTRLTHTLEVMQVARTCARALQLNEDLTEAIALAHDLGHSPFGHLGEKHLSHEMEVRGVRQGFHHNFQSLRIVDHLEHEGRGLNLSHEVRQAIPAHSKGQADSTLAMAPHVSLEAQVVKHADRIAYLAADLEDAYRASMLVPGDLEAAGLGHLAHDVKAIIRRAVTDLVEQSTGIAEVRLSQSALDEINALKNFLFEQVYLTGKVQAEDQRIARLLAALFASFDDDATYVRYLGEPPAESEARIQATCDFIAGMTDRYAVRVLSDLMIPREWSFPR